MANQPPPPGVYRDKSATWKQNLIWVAVAIVGVAGGALFISRLPPPEAPLKKNEEGVVVGKPSTLIVSAGMPGVQVFIEGKEKGTTDDKGQVKLELPSNAYYFVEVKKDGFSYMSTSVRLGLNEEREVNFEMQPEKADSSSKGKKK